jgi:3'-phosphoadenosine 5'-phosphosulfate sulfotransferase (PAPS reductase)/FAD synthetase
MNEKIEQARKIIQDAIDEYKPVSIVALYSGGYDSLVMTHVVHNHFGGIKVRSINTMMSADGWEDYVRKVASRYGWNHGVYRNERGFEQYKKWVAGQGQPYTPSSHHKVYNRLKGRAIDAMKRDEKRGHSRTAKVLFLSGIRKFEGASAKRAKLTSPYSHYGSAVFCNPLFWWRDDDLIKYRIANNLPENPFYDTVSGSGDCQCNWGQFTDMETLVKHSPELAKGNVSEIDRISRENHGYGWGESPDYWTQQEKKGQRTLFDLPESDDAQTTPFLCANCSRGKDNKSNEAEANHMFQRGFDWG